MSLPMSPEVESLIQREYKSGLYESTDDLLLEAVLLLRDRNQRLVELRQAILPALERLERGAGKPLDMDRIKTEGRRRLDGERAPPGAG
jgi:antitoxin ParD1/3/4